MNLKREVLLKPVIIAVVLALFFIVFRLFQNEKIYMSTLGRISENYIHDEQGINKIVRPYQDITEENIICWDAAHYNMIRLHSYAFDMKNKNEDFAFFPFFPYVWRWTGLNAFGICIFNFILFAIAFAWLSQMLIPASASLTDRLLLFTVGLVLPSTVIFRMPYTESFFFVSFVIAVYGLLKKKYFLFFIGCALLANARPAVTIVLLSVLCTEIYFFILHRNFLNSAKQFTLIALPLAAGTLMACLIQYPYSHNLFYFVVALKNWGRHFSIPHSFTDWSVEGFGMSVASIFIVVIPVAVLFLKKFRTDLKSPVKKAKSIFSGDVVVIKDWLLVNTIIYCIGIFFFIALFQGGALNGLQRYIIATPFFYILLYLLYEKINNYLFMRKLIVFVLLFIAGWFFMTHSGYRDHFEFSLMGFVLTFISIFFISVLQNMNKIISVAGGLILLFANIVWLTYLFNMFLSDAWIFT